MARRNEIIFLGLVSLIVPGLGLLMLGQRSKATGVMFSFAFLVFGPLGLFATTLNTIPGAIFGIGVGLIWWLGTWGYSLWIIARHSYQIGLEELSFKSLARFYFDRHHQVNLHSPKLVDGLLGIAGFGFGNLTVLGVILFPESHPWIWLPLGIYLMVLVAFSIWL